jgi:predicted phage terminase large subunit-like protein
MQKLPISPRVFARKASGGKWSCPRHLEYLNDRLLDVAAGKCKRLMVFLPPRHGKSEFISKYFAAWYLGTFPDRRVILTSYEADFAAQWGRRARELIEEFGKLSFVETVGVMPDSSAASRWDIKGRVGGMVTAGVGGPITGKGGHLIIIDDPVKNAEQASSTTYREKAWEWYQSTLYTRLEPNGAIILIMTRWNQGDLAGRILQDMQNGGERWDIINLPAIAEDDDQIGRSPGTPLWPDRFGVPELENIKRTVGSYYWTALYQQRPTPQEGGMFKRQWFPIIDAAPHGLVSRVRRWDLAASQQKGDYTAGLLMGKKEGRFYVLDLQHVRESPAGVESLVKQTAQVDGHDVEIRMEREPGSSGLNTIDYYARRVLEGYNFKGIPSTGPKEVRAQPVSAAAEAGNVILVRGSWNAAFLDEVTLFPNGDHDDIVDVLSGAFTDLTRNTGGRIWVTGRKIGDKT